MCKRKLEIQPKLTSCRLSGKQGILTGNEDRIYEHRIVPSLHQAVTLNSSTEVSERSYTLSNCRPAAALYESTFRQQCWGSKREQVTKTRGQQLTPMQLIHPASSLSHYVRTTCLGLVDTSGCSRSQSWVTMARVQHLRRMISHWDREWQGSRRSRLLK